MAIKIDFLADYSKFLRGTKDIGGALEDVAEDLEGLGRDSERAGDQAGAALGDAFKDGSREAGRALDDVSADLKGAGQDADRLETRVAQAFRTMGRDAKTSGKQIGDSQREGFRKAGDGAETFKEEADANAREVAASFDGSAESIADGFQGLAAEALAGFGPAGMAAGLALAAGIGIAVSKMQEGAEEATAYKEAVVEIAGAVADAGGRIEDVDFAAIIRDWGREVQEDNWLTFWVDEAESNFQKYADLAEEAGVATRDAIRGMKGSADDSQGFLDGTADEWERLGKVIEEGTTVTARGGVVLSQTARDASDKRDALRELRDGAQENLDTQREAIDVYNIEADALGNTADQAERAAEAVRDKADAARETASAAMEATSADVAWRQGLEQLSADIAANGQNLDLNTAAGQANAQSLVELAQKANALIAARVAEGASSADATAKAQELRTAYVDQAIQAGYSREAAEALATSYGLIPENVSTMVQAQGTEEAAAAVDAAAQDKEANVNVTTNGTEAGAQGAVNTVTGKDAPVNVTAEGTPGQVQQQIDGIRGRDVEIDVQDFDSVRDTQRRIDGLRGKDVPITVSISNLGTIQRQLDDLTRPREAWVTVNERKGQAVAP